MIYGIGMLENGITWDYAQLVMEDDFMKMILKTCEGVLVDDEHLAVDVINEVGPGGEFISHMHTFQNFKHLSQPDAKIIDRDVYKRQDTKRCVTALFTVVSAILEQKSKISESQRERNIKKKERLLELYLNEEITEDEFRTARRKFEKKDVYKRQEQG